MKTTLIATLFALAAIGAADASAQQPNIKPGLWQLDMTLPGKMKAAPIAGYLDQLKAQMASMPPEQRRQLEAALGGLEARGTQFTGDGMRTKECITQENLAKFDFLGNSAPDTCTRKSSPTAGGVNVSMTCTRPQMKVDAAVTFQSDQAYTFEALTTLAGPDGKPVSQKSSGSGKWLGSDCGTIKPASTGG